MTPWRALFVSDVHKGARGSKGARLRDFLANNPADVIYIVGDLFDGLHALRAPDLIDTLRAFARAPHVVFTPGNHDAFARRFVGRYGHVEICVQAIHAAGDGRRYVVTHGDEFDGSLCGPLPWLGSYARYIAPAAALRAVNQIATRGRLAERLSELALAEGAAGVITGHFHDPGVRVLPGGGIYYDLGDWLTSCTALVEARNGSLQIVRG